MGLFSKEKGTGAMDVIRCDEPDYLIWKWRPAGNDGPTLRENAIRWGSSLRVRDGSVAVFVYSDKDGSKQDYIEGPYDQTLHTKNFPVLINFLGAAYDGKSPFQAEVYFINLAHVIQVKFAVPFFEVFDPRFLDFGVPVAVRGTIGFKISDYKEFIKLHRLENFDMNDFTKQVSDAISRYVKDAVANAPADHGIPVVQLERKIGDINRLVEGEIVERFARDFGVAVSGVDIASIEIDKTSDGYKELLAVTKDATSATIKAQTSAGVKNIYDTQRIQAEDTGARLKMDREETGYARHKQTQSANLAAFQMETQGAVGVAGAEALGKMGQHGATEVSFGGRGMNVAGMMAGMAMGGAIGRNTVSLMNGMQNAMNQPVAPNTPPPVPVASYQVVIDGKATGPYDLTTLGVMAKNGAISGDSLVWKSGMADWAKASSMDDLKALFGDVVPPVPGA